MGSFLQLPPPPPSFSRFLWPVAIIFNKVEGYTILLRREGEVLEDDIWESAQLIETGCAMFSYLGGEVLWWMLLGRKRRNFL